MGRRGYSQGGGGTTRKTSKLERARFQDVFRFGDRRGRRKRTEAEFRTMLELIVKAQAYYDAQAWDETEPLVRELLTYEEFQQGMAYDSLGAVLERQGKIHESIKMFRKALEVDPDYIDARSRLIMILDALPETTAERAQKERDLWWQHHGAENYKRRLGHAQHNRDPERPLRVGYVSGDFQFHSAATVFERVLLRHTEAIQPYFYSTTPHDKHDHKTVAYQSHWGWRDLRERDGPAGKLWPDVWVWNKILMDEIDILVDLSGYTACNALPVFCFKPAPVQITGWGYATGVGWKAMDYLMADRVVVPEDRQHEHVEKILYMPCVINYEPMDGFPQTNALPCLTERPTFGVFQRSLKLNADEFEVWRRILERLPESRLLFKSHYPQSLVEWVRGHFGAQAHQVEFQFATSALAHKAAYAQVDLSLDCWPQTGGVSSCDSLWMGVPMVTLIGDRVIQRTSASLLTILGLTEFIVDTKEQYIESAVQWVTTRKHELAAIRGRLREQCDASPIRQGYLEATEAAYRRAWREWCAQPFSKTGISPRQSSLELLQQWAKEQAS